METTNTAKRKVILLGVLLLAGWLFGYQGVWKWTICHNWVEPGTSLQLTRKTGREREKASSFAGPEESGVLEEMRGPGRHLDINPWVYTATTVDDFTVHAGNIGIVTTKVGEDLPSGQFLAEPQQKGIQRKVLTPGKWRINPYGATVKEAPATIVPPGYIGVQTILDGDRRVLGRVLPPGMYYINPYEILVTMVNIGYRTEDFHTDVDRDGQPVPGTGVSFTTKDGFTMFLDLTTVWGIEPLDGPRIVQDYGTTDTEDKLVSTTILPQTNSIVRLDGSNYNIKEFIIGGQSGSAQNRDVFQSALTGELAKIGQQKGFMIPIVVVRGIHPPIEVSEPIRSAKLAEETTLTLNVRKETDTKAGELEEATQKVEIALKDFSAQTSMMVEAERATGEKLAAETDAQTRNLVASIKAQTAAVQAQRVTMLGKAAADVLEAKKRAQANRFQLAVAAVGGGDTYNLLKFAEGLPDDMDIEIRYAGDGTLWTNAPQDAALMGILQELKKKAAEQKEAAVAN